MLHSLTDDFEKDKLKTRLLLSEEAIPYSLLLLADETKEAIDKYIFQSELFVMEREEEIVGVYALYAENDQRIEIKNIAVAQAFQGKGIGTRLLEDAVVRAKQKGFKSVLIGTGDASASQLRLYKKNGFEPYQIREGFFLQNYTEPIFENGVQLKDMIVLKKDIV